MYQFLKNFLQSKEWLNAQRKLGKTAFYYSNYNMKCLVIIEKYYFGKYIYIPYGPIIYNKENLNLFLFDLINICNKKKIDFIRIEPLASSNLSTIYLKNQLFIKSPKNIHPSESWIIDLRFSMQKIFSSMKANCRNIYRNIYKKNVKLIVTQDFKDINILLKLLKKTSERLKFKAVNKEYLFITASTLMKLGKAYIYIAYLNNIPIASALVYDSYNVRTYVHAANDMKYKKLNAGTALIIKIIIDAKSKNMKIFDFWGIDSSLKNKKWKGFTKFKQSFGGKAIKHYGCWDFPVKKKKYKIYRMLYIIKKILKI